MKKKGTPIATTDDRLVDALARIANMEEKVESLHSEAALFVLFDESTKQKMIRLMMGSGEHYYTLINAVDGLERLKEKYKERFLRAPPFKLGEETEKEIIENQVSVEKSMVMVYETILKLLDELGDRAEIKKKGVRVIPDKVKSAVKENLASEKRHVAAAEEILRLFREAHLDMEHFDKLLRR